ncbi:MFS transporter [Occallatibacter savannae]|uniref:MFS transporter n=1 Tax=Occallatibacter savannae TaxID=1002691 RepID=UPI000D6964B7|nr:MFS transporter [Occallatibacter savannae]
MPEAESQRSSRELYVYFSLLALLVNVTSPQWVLDIPTSYMLKDLLHATASQVSRFRLITGIPLYLGFAFGLVRDSWNPFGWRDPGYFRIFVPLTLIALAGGAFSQVTYSGLVFGMLFATVSYSFIAAAFQGLLALVGQEDQMPGRLSTLSNMAMCTAAVLGYFASGWMSTTLSPRQVFLFVMALTALLGAFAFWKPQSVFRNTYQNPHAQRTNFSGEVKRLAKHRAIYPVILIALLWFFTPGVNTPLQYYFANQLHAPDSVYANFSAVMYVGFIPTTLLYGVLCTRFRPSKLLWWSMIVGVPQFIPMAFIHTGGQALVAAFLIGLLGGLGNSAVIDMAIRACPAGLQGTLMMIVMSLYPLSSRMGDVLGSWLFGLSPTHGFQYCVVAITCVYALILPLIPLLPKQIIATADGEQSLEDEALLLA